MLDQHLVVRCEDAPFLGVMPYGTASDVSPGLPLGFSKIDLPPSLARVPADHSVLVPGSALPRYEDLAASVTQLHESSAVRDSLIAEVDPLLEEAPLAGKRRPGSRQRPMCLRYRTRTRYRAGAFAGGPSTILGRRPPPRPEPPTCPGAVSTSTTSSMLSTSKPTVPNFSAVPSTARAPVSDDQTVTGFVEAVLLWWILTDRPSH